MVEAESLFLNIVFPQVASSYEISMRGPSLQALFSPQPIM